MLSEGTPAQLSIKAYRLRRRARQTQNPHRKSMLMNMADAALCFGLAKTHVEWNSPKADYIFEAAADYVNRARMGLC